ncbi:MAG: hypothetical protein GY716_09210 [bacterium]|nr:hypothetical protein [bacterium]
MSRVQKARLGMLVGPESVHVVAVDGAKRPKLIGFADVEVPSQGDPGAALAEAIGQVGVTGPARLVLLGADTRHLHVRLPKLGRAELRETLHHLAVKELGELPEGFLSATWMSAIEPDGQRDVVHMLTPREPLETWAAMLQRLGCPLESVTSPAALALPRERPDEAGGCLWAEIGGSRTCISLYDRRNIVLMREIPRRAIDADDFLGLVERRLADFQEIERSILYFRENHDERGIRRVVLSGALEEIEPMRDQIAPPMQELEIDLEIADAWHGIDRGDSIDASSAVRGALAARALVPRRLLAVTPGVVRLRRRAQRKRWLAVVAAAALAVVAAGFAATTRLEHEVLLDDLADAQDRLEIVLEQESDPVEPADEGPLFDVRTLPAPDWSPMLREVGLLARPGVDYDTVRMQRDGSDVRLRLEGRVRSAATERTGALLAELLNGVDESPYSAEIPSLHAVSDDGPRRGESVRFTVETRLDPGAPGDGERP